MICNGGAARGGRDWLITHSYEVRKLVAHWERRRRGEYCKFLQSREVLWVGFGTDRVLVLCEGCNRIFCSHRRGCSLHRPRSLWPRRWPVARRPFDSWELFFLLFFFKVTLNALRVSAYLATQTFPPPPPQFSSLARFSCVNPNCLLCVKDNICTVVVFGQEITVFCREQWPSCCDYQILNLSAFRTCLTSPTAHFFTW